MAALVSEEKKWDYAIGLAKVDEATPSPEFLELVEREKRGEITTDQMIEMTKKKYTAGR